MSRRNIISQNQLALPFSERAAKAISYEDRTRFFWFLSGVAFLSLVLYVYGINAAAHNIALRENLEKEVSEINAKLSSLEFASIEAKNAITLDTAHEYGFAEVREPLYVSRGASHSLTLNTAVR